MDSNKFQRAVTNLGYYNASLKLTAERSLTKSAKSPSLKLRERLSILKRKKKTSKFQGILNFFKKFDLYGEQVSLKYKGEEKFTTLYGSIVSLIILFFIFIYTIQQAN